MITHRKPLLKRVFGKLTVTEEIPSTITYASNPTIKCQCQCGNECEVKLNNLQRGKTKSCGCLRSAILKRYSREKNNNYVNKAGLKHGVWTYLNVAENTPIGRGVYWEYQCECGKILIQRNKPSVYGCKSCSEKNRPKKPKQEKYLSKEGYVYLLVEQEHTRSNKQGYVLEHLIVMEKRIGRPVKKTETVHHINGVRSDNRDENLELWDKNHPTGQRNSEKMEFYMKELKEKCDATILKNFCESILKNNNE